MLLVVGDVSRPIFEGAYRGMVYVRVFIRVSVRLRCIV